MKKLLVVLFAAFLVFSLSACNPGTETEKTRMILIIPGTLGDKSYLDAAGVGAEKIEEQYGDEIEVTVREIGRDETNFLPALYDAADEGYDLIFTITWGMQQYLEEVAPQYPDQKFLVIDTGLNFDEYDLDNSYAAVFKPEEGSYLAGAVAAMVSETGTIGFLGGMDITGINDFLVGYIEGAQSVNPDIKVAISYIGNFNDSAKGKEMALAQYNNGVDIGYNVAGGAGLGQIDAAVEAGKLAIGVDSDQFALFDGVDQDKADVIVTSMIKAIDVVMLQAIELYLNDSWPGGTVEYLGIPAVGLIKNDMYKSHLTAEEQATIDQLEADIISGAIEVGSAVGMTTEELTELRDSVK
jgi:basic membrane protein A